MQLTMENHRINYLKRRWKIKLHKYWFDSDGIVYEVLKEKGNHVRLDYSNKLNKSYKIHEDISKKYLFENFTTKSQKND